MLFQSKTKHIKARQPVWQWLVVRAHRTADEISNTLSLVRTCAPQSDLSPNYLVGVEGDGVQRVKTEVKCIFRRGWRARAAESKSPGSRNDTASFLFFFPNSFDSTLWTELHNCDIERMEEPIGVAQYECRIRKWHFCISKNATSRFNGHIHHS